MNIPFSLPLIDSDVINEMNDTLVNSGWLTSGPKVLQLEEEVKKITRADAVICVNSWVSGAMLVMRWFGIGYGDEVIVPSYTYCATALACMNIGAKPVMVDVLDDFTMDPEKLKRAITPRTKAVIPVDLGGWPCAYDSIAAVLNDPSTKKQFIAQGPNQEKLGRPLFIADAAHAIGAKYKNKPVGSVSDVSIFSFHSVKNVTTGEGGAVCLKLPEIFSVDETYRFIKILSMNGQTKSGFEKTQEGGWKYDIVTQGLKVNMPDICASIGLAQIRKYEKELLPERIKLFDYYNEAFSSCPWAILPPCKTHDRESSYHLYLLRIKGINENQRDQMIQHILGKGVGVNVHYTPPTHAHPLKNLGYTISDHSNTYNLYANEITLPVYNGLKEEQLKHVVRIISEAYTLVCS